MRFTPSAVTILEAERDPELPAKLRAELPGFLRWAVGGCLAWQRAGLRPPELVRQATAACREENDALGEFFRLHVVFERDATIARKELCEVYGAFCEENGAEPFGANCFACRLRERGVSETSVRRGSSVVDGWKGVRLATEAERVAALAWTRRDVGTCREESSYPAPRARTEEVMPESPPTSRYDPTGDEETFGEYLQREGIGGQS
jgi:phage/plasmid-associated DNA primase